MIIVDAHPHIYSPDTKRYPPIADPLEPGVPAAVEDLKRRMDETGVARAVFIQTSTYYEWDNRYVMDSARANREWATAVVTLSPDDPSHLEVLEEAVLDCGVRGLRGKEDAAGSVCTPGVYRLWTKARDLGVVVNCFVGDDLDRVPEIERIASDIDDLRVVIDHCFMLRAGRKKEETLAALRRLSALPNVYAKLTCGATGSNRAYPHEDMHDPLKQVIEYFGPERCVWGSDFPNELWTRGTSYSQNLSLFTEELGLPEAEQEAILSTTALGLWFQ
ncbi:MAG: amidohydrolase family protein [Chloroflexi bacterium]|nr:amidohydrolase family protein [Chloroflexota bacterium]